MLDHPISCLIFDFDGTLATCPYDFAYMRRSVLGAAADYGIDPVRLTELGLLEIVEAGTSWLAASDADRAAAFHVEAMRRLCAIEYEAAAGTELLPGIVEALGSLRAAGMQLGIVTRNSYAAVARIIGDAPLPYQALLAREHVAHPKPHPDHAHEMLRLLHSSPANALMVGDHPMDIRMGQDAGMRTAAVLTGQSHEAELRAVHPDMLLPSVVELTGLLLDNQV